MKQTYPVIRGWNRFELRSKKGKKDIRFFIEVRGGINAVMDILNQKVGHNEIILLKPGVWGLTKDDLAEFPGKD